MSLYNTICPNNPLFTLYIAMLEEAGPLMGPPRFRDMYLTTEGEGEIVLYTRTGGGNRAEHELDNDALKNHPLFIRDHDDASDNTFAHWHFRIPGKYRAVMIRLHGILNRFEKFFPPERKLDAAFKRMHGKEVPSPAPLSDEEAVAVDAMLTQLAADLGMTPSVPTDQGESAEEDDDETAVEGGE